MSNTKTVHVSHLGGIDAAYQMLVPYEASKPTIVLVNSMTTSSELYTAQYTDKELLATANLLAIEPLGHGQTRTKCENWTYWDTSYMNIQVLDALGIQGRVFVLGTSQGGWIAVRMALLAPERVGLFTGSMTRLTNQVAGIMPLGTSLDFESDRTRQLGCWDAPTGLTPIIDQWSINELTPDFAPGEDYCNFVVDTGLGKDCSGEVRKFWVETIQRNYAGDNGRRRIRMAAINLRDRDGLHPRLFDVKCPVLWLHGTSDQVYSASNAEEEIELFVNSSDAKLVLIQDGQHFLSFSNPGDVNTALVQFVRKYGN